MIKFETGSVIPARVIGGVTYMKTFSLRVHTDHRTIELVARKQGFTSESMAKIAMDAMVTHLNDEIDNENSIAFLAGQESMVDTNTKYSKATGEPL